MEPERLLVSLRKYIRIGLGNQLPTNRLCGELSRRPSSFPRNDVGLIGELESFKQFSASTEFWRLVI